MKSGRISVLIVSTIHKFDDIAVAYENRQLTTQEALAAYQQLATEREQETTERVRLNLDGNTYAVYKVPEGYAEAVTPDQAREVNSTFDQFPDYRWSDERECVLRGALYKILRPIVKGKSVMDPTNTLLKLERI